MRDEPDRVKVARSEHGLVWDSDAEVNLPPIEVARRLRHQVDADLVWAQNRRRKFRRRATATKIVSLALTSGSVAVLALQEPTVLESTAVFMIASVTVLNAVEQFMGWRSRFVLMEEAHYRLGRLRDVIDYFLLTTAADGITKEDLAGFFNQWQRVRGDVSRRWVQFRTDPAEAGVGGLGSCGAAVSSDVRSGLGRGVWFRLPVTPSPPAPAAWSGIAAASRVNRVVDAPPALGSDLRRPRELAAPDRCLRRSQAADMSVAQAVADQREQLGGPRRPWRCLRCGARPAGCGPRRSPSLRTS
jgi:hypothetical protein